MPARITLPDPDTRIGRHESGAELYAKDLRDEFPLYRELKLITPRAWQGGRRTAHLSWIVHCARLRSGGDAWQLAQHHPALHAWILECAAAVFDASYVKDTFGLSDAEYDALVAAEHAKYPPKG